MSPGPGRASRAIGGLLGAVCRRLRLMRGLGGQLARCPAGGARELAMEISLTSLGSSQTLRTPQVSTLAASLFCSLSDTMPGCPSLPSGRAGQAAQSRNGAAGSRACRACGLRRDLSALALSRAAVRAREAGSAGRSDLHKLLTA